MIDFTVPDELGLTINGLLAFTRAEVEPLEAEHRDLLDNPHACYDATGRLVPAVRDLSRQVRMAAAQAGYYSLFTPVDVGGGGQGPLTLFHVWEALYQKGGAGRMLPYEAVSHWATGPSAVMRSVRPSVHSEVLPGLLSGERTSCFALSEPDAGSDVWGMKTRAERRGDSFVINGVKQWITNAPYADHGVLFAVTDPVQQTTKRSGITAFLIDTSTPGFSVDSVIRLYGHGGGHEAIISFTDMVVPAERVIGEVSQGFPLALLGVSNGRIYNAARSVGLSRWALERATAYAQQRKAFGQAIAEYQGVQWLLADSAMETYAARMMAINCAWQLEQGETAIKETAMVKAFATEAGFRTLDRCMQAFGGMGLTNEMRLTDAWHQIRTVRIADGSGEIMRRTIAQRLLRGDLSF